MKFSVFRRPANMKMQQNPQTDLVTIIKIICQCGYYIFSCLVVQKTCKSIKISIPTFFTITTENHITKSNNILEHCPGCLMNGVAISQIKHLFLVLKLQQEVPRHNFLVIFTMKLIYYSSKRRKQTPPQKQRT